MVDFSGVAGTALVSAFFITLLEMTDVVALVYALGSGSKSMRPGLLGATGGVAIVSLAAIGVGLALVGVPDALTHAVGTVIIWGFSFVLLNSTFKTYRREAQRKAGIQTRKKEHPSPDTLTSRDLAVTGLAVGAGETIEAAIPLLAISATSGATPVVLGALAAGATIAIAAHFLHAHIKRIKVPLLKWVATSILFAFAMIWTLETLGNLTVIYFPTYWGSVPTDILLIPFTITTLGLVRYAIHFDLKAQGLSWNPSPNRT